MEAMTPDTVAAIAGQCLYPTSGIRYLHGWPGKRADDLIEAVYLVVEGRGTG